MRVEVEAPCNPTEDVKKVEKAVKKIFPDLEISIKAGRLIGTGSSIGRFGECLKDQRIRSAARAVLLSSQTANRVTFTLNKQVAFIGKVSFGSGSPLGDISVTIVDDDIDSIIDSIAPRLGDVSE
ncbi:MAG: RNA-binding domain-containing protein [Thermoplasmata archaeon]